MHGLVSRFLAAPATRRAAAVRGRLFLALMAALVVVGPNLAPQPASAQSGLFSDVTTTRQGETPTSRDPTVVRSRPVNINLGQVDSGNAPPRARVSNTDNTLVLNLFNNVNLTAVRDRVEPTSSGAGFIWHGHVQGPRTAS